MCRNHIPDEPFAALLGDSIISAKTPCTKHLIEVFKQCKKKSTISNRRFPEIMYAITESSADEIEQDVYKVKQLIESLNLLKLLPIE